MKRDFNCPLIFYTRPKRLKTSYNMDNYSTEGSSVLGDYHGGYF